MGKNKVYYEKEASQAEWLEWFQTNEHKQYQHPDVTVDLLLTRFNYRTKQLEVLLRKRAIQPFRGQWGLLGTYYKTSHADIQDAQSELWHTVLKSKSFMNKRLEYIGQFSKSGRDPRGQVVSFANVAFIPDTWSLDMTDKKWVSLSSLINDEHYIELAFDHREIIIEGYLTILKTLKTSKRLLLSLHDNFSLSDVIALQADLTGRNKKTYNRANVRKFILPVTKSRLVEQRKTVYNFVY